MKLNAGIIFEHLRKSFDVELHGESSGRLHLPRPIFYMDSQRVFEADRLYLASADHLPAHPAIRNGVVLVCIGESLQLHRYLNKCTVIQVKENVDFFSVYLAIQEVFDLYDSWNDGLFELFKHDADIVKIVSLSSDVLSMPIILIDGNFHILATSHKDSDTGARQWRDEGENLSLYSLSNYLSANELHTDEHDPMVLKAVDTSSLNINLFDARDCYIGCLSFILEQDEPPLGLDALATYLARIIEAAIIKNPSLLVTEHSARKGVLRDLVEGKPISLNQRRLLEPTTDDTRYVCVSLHTYGREQPLPSSFICSSFEIAFPESYSFQTEQMVVGVIDLSGMAATTSTRVAVDERLASLVDALKLSAGVSFDFADLHDVPVYVRQAEAALVDGSILHPESAHHYFEDYALTELVVNAISGVPIESLFPPELKRVVEHDKSSPISYLETLKVFLGENMNYSRVASMLYIHRSTLVDRIDKIEHSYGLDLHDPDTRLYLQLILKALDVERAIRENG